MSNEMNTAGMTKKDVVGVVKVLMGENFAKDLSKKLVNKMKSALDMNSVKPAQVTKESLVAMIEEAKKELRAKLEAVTAQRVVENSLKPTKGHPSTPAEAKEAKGKTAPAKEAPKGKLAPATAPAKSGKPAPAPAKEAPAKKKAGVVSAPAVRKTDVPVAKFFPETLESEDLGTLVRADKKYKNYKAIAKAIDEGKQLVFACYWTKRHIKEFSYALTREVECPKSFPEDLDLVQAIVACQNVPRIFGMSVYTEALYQFNGESFEAVEDVDPATGEAFKVRVSNGMEFEVYEAEEAEESEEEEE